MQDALDALWPYTGEMFVADEKDAQVAAAGLIARPGQPQARLGARPSATC